MVGIILARDIKNMAIERAMKEADINSDRLQTRLVEKLKEVTDASERLFYNSNLEKLITRDYEDTLDVVVAYSSFKMKFKGLCANIFTEVFRRASKSHPALKNTDTEIDELAAGLYDTLDIYSLSDYLIIKLKDLSGRILNIDSNIVIKKVLNYISNNYSKDLTLKMLGELFGYNSGYLGKAIKNYSGEAFNDYLEKVRIQKAMELLQKGYKAGDVACMVGFKNLDYFYFKFKKNVGVSTSEYKRNASWHGNI